VALPLRLAGLGRLPQGEVGRVALAGALERARARLGVGQAAVGELAVVGVLGDVEPHVALGRVRDAALDQHLRHLQDVRDVLGRLGEVVDRVDAEREQRVLVVLRLPLGQLRHRRAFLLGGLDQLVVDVGDVDRPT
jgi:hypothetical protein